jgi:hypothetical protein
LFDRHNKEQNKKYRIDEISFPKSTPYGWHNYPFDYYNLWVKHAGPDPWMEEPTLEMLTQQYQVIIFKHCFPVSNIGPDQDSADIDSDYKSLANYKLQYLALREKLHQFPDTKFIVWTGAAQVQRNTNEDEAKRAGDFFGWVTDVWDLPGDNIFIWDFYGLQTENQLYFKDQYASSPADAHPNRDFSVLAAKQLYHRIIDVIESDGTKTSLTGSPK